MLRLIIPAVGFVAAMAVCFYLVMGNFGQQDHVEVASLDPNTGLSMDIFGQDTADAQVKPKHSDTHTEAVTAQSTNRFLPEAPSGWERLGWNSYFVDKFLKPDDTDHIHSETYVYLKPPYAFYLRVKLTDPSLRMVADLLQVQRYVEGGGKLDDLKKYRMTVDHTVKTVRSISDGWSISGYMNFKHFKAIDGVAFIVGKPDAEAGDKTKLRYFYGSLGGGAIVKMRTDAPNALAAEILEEIDFSGLNMLQQVPNPLIGEGIPDDLLGAPEAWLRDKKDELRKLKRASAGALEGKVAIEATTADHTKDQTEAAHAQH